MSKNKKYTSLDISDYVESHKKDYCIEKKNNRKDRKNKKNKRCCELRCAQCLVAGNEACDAPVINKLVNTVYTTLSCFPFSENGMLTTINGTNEYCFSYYISLPCEFNDEIRLLWPVTWIIPQLIQKLLGKFSGTGNVIVKFLLNIMSKKIIKAPAQVTSTLNTGGIVNGPCVCDSTSAVYDYTFNFAFVSGSPSSILSTVSPSYLTFSAPNNAVAAQFTIDPSTLNLIPQTSANLLNFIVGVLISDLISGQDSPFPSTSLPSYVALLASIGATSVQIAAFTTFFDAAQTAGSDITITLTGTTITFTATGTFSGTFVFPVPNIVIASSPAQYVSFVPSCEKGDCKSYWVATNLETERV